MSEKNLFLVEEGNPVYKIIVPSGKRRDYEITASEELKNLLFSATGYTFEVFPDKQLNPITGAPTDTDLVWSSEDKYISLGKTSIAKQAGFIVDRTEVGFTGYGIKTIGNTVCLLGGGVAGTLFAVYDFLKRVVGYELNNLNGPDEMLLCGLSVGADGAVGTTYNIVPKLPVKIYENYKKGDMKTALEYQNKLNLFIQTMFGFIKGRGLGYWKACLSLLGFDMGYTVFPSTPVSESDLVELKEMLNGIRFFDEFV